MKYINVQNHGPISIVEVSRPESLNALNVEVLRELHTFLKESEENSSMRAIILTGAGEKSFIAGADIKAMSTMDNHEVLQFCALGQDVALCLERSPHLTIAAVNGFALGGGLEMALACDYIYAAQSARLGLPEVTLGIIPGFGGTQRLSRVVGTRKAKELILSARVISADEAFQYGIVNKVCSSQSLINECVESANIVIRNSALAISKAKKAIDMGYESSLENGMDIERKLFVDCFSSQGRIAGFEQFLKKYDNKDKH